MNEKKKARDKWLILKGITRQKKEEIKQYIKEGERHRKKEVLQNWKAPWRTAGRGKCGK